MLVIIYFENCFWKGVVMGIFLEYVDLVFFDGIWLGNRSEINFLYVMFEILMKGLRGVEMVDFFFIDYLNEIFIVEVIV